MRTGEALLLGGAALILGEYYIKGRTISRLNFMAPVLKRFYFINAEPAIDISLQVQNTSSNSLAVSSASLNLYMNNTYLGTAYNFSPVTILGNSISQIPLTIVLQANEVVSQLFHLLTYKTGSQELVLDGTVNVAGSQYKINFPFNAF